MNKFGILISFLALGASPAFASTTYLFLDSRAGNQNSESYNGSSYDISPYGGSIGSNKNGDAGNSAVKLFCDDFSDDAHYGSGWQVNVTNVNAADLSNTRFGSANANIAFPSGTTLYEETAWLFTQSMNAGQSTANQDAIQEAVWLMTDPTGTPKATATATGANKTYLQWIDAAKADYRATVAGYSTPDYSNWMIVTDTAAKGNTGGKGNQEFLAYYAAGGVPTVTGTTGSATTTPEPGSFLLLGTGLMLGSFFGLRSLNRRGR